MLHMTNSRSTVGFTLESSNVNMSESSSDRKLLFVLRLI